jgi:hypothetical protein
MHEPALLSPYADLMLSMSLFVPWLILYGSRPDVRRRQRLRISLGPIPLGLTESLYWSSVYEHLAWKRCPGAKSVPAGSPVGSAR